MTPPPLNLPSVHKHSVTVNQTITHTIVKQKILFLHTAEGRQACGGTEIRPHPSVEMSYSPPTNNQQVHAARLSGIGPDGVIPSARQRVTSWTEITPPPAFKNTLTRGRRGDIELNCVHPLPSPPPQKGDWAWTLQRHVTLLWVSVSVRHLAN